ncbi:MAG: alpha/beta hydrolase [Chitinophagaceae bacterium]
MLRHCLPVLLAGLLLAAGCSKQNSENEAPASEQKILTGISYGAHAQQQMDVYLPAGRSAQTPLLIFLHGGGFVAGDKGDVARVAALFTAKGYAVVNANYRLIDATGLDQQPILHQPSAVKIADQLADIRALVNKIATLSAGWQVSPDQWVLAGHSAGATLALLYAHGEHNQDRRVKAGVNVAGAITFAYSDESEVALADPLLVEVLYRATGVPATNANKLAYMAISPYWVSSRDLVTVPVMNIRPSQDTGHELYLSYTQLLTGNNTVNRYRVIEGAGHGLEQPGKLEEAVTAADEFLKEIVL